MKPRLATTILTHCVLAFAALAVLYPVLWVVRTAFSDEAVIASNAAFHATGKNFAAFFFAKDFNGRPLFFLQLGNSLLVGGAATVIGVLAAVSAAYAFSRFAFPLRKAGLRAMLVSQMFPAVVTGVPLLFLLDALGLFGSTAGLVLVYATSSVPFSIWMLKGYFDAIPKELEEAARLDGASSFFIFRRVMLPLVRSGIGITALFSFMTAYNEFIMASLFLDDASNYTLPITLQEYVGGFDPSWGVFAAGSIVLSIPIVVLFFYVQRAMTSGMLTGAVKG